METTGIPRFTPDLEETRVCQQKYRYLPLLGGQKGKRGMFSRIPFSSLSQKAEPFRVAYEQNIADFVTQVQDLREKKEELEPQFILRCIQAEVLFLRSALKHAEQCEESIRRRTKIFGLY
jgi:hypothetical protein